MADSREDMIKQWEEHNKITVDGVQYTPSELEASHKRSGENLDPYTNALNGVGTMASRQAPRVSVNNGDVVIEAPESVMQSPIIEQLNKELQTLKGADLNSAEVKNAINALNEEIQTNWKNSLINQSTGWTPEEYKDYQYAIQTISGTNPMKSSNKIKGKTKEGVVTAKTPQEWVDYWREVYNTNERVDALQNSAYSKNPYDRTMYLVLTQGGDKAVYGFDGFEKLGDAYKAFENQMMKFPEGTFKKMFGNIKGSNSIESDQVNFKIPKESFTKNDVINKEQFDARIQNIWGKSWEDLSDDDKAFVLMLSHITKDDEEDRKLASSGRTKIEQLAGLHPGMTLRPEIQNMDSADAVSRILFHSNYDDYKEVKDSFLDWQNYKEDRDQDDIRLAKNAIMSETEQGIGNFTGTIGRFLWEAAVARGLTGGIMPGGVNVNAISDTIGEKIVGTLTSKGISPASKFGQGLMSFMANLVGTVPEDILQTSLDNVLTDNAQENAHLFDWDQMSDNLKQNLITMTLFNAARAGVSAVKRAQFAKQAAKAMDLNSEVDFDGAAIDTDDLTRALNRGEKLEVDDSKVRTTAADGTETIYEDISPEAGRYLQQSLLDSDSPKVKNADGTDVDNPKMKYDEDGNLIDDGGPKKYDLEGLDTQLRVRVEPTPAGIRNWHQKAIKTMMKVFEKHLDEFHTKFPGVQASDFDWIWYQTKFNKLTPDQIVGTFDPSTGRTMTKR